MALRLSKAGFVRVLHPPLSVSVRAKSWIFRAGCHKHYFARQLLQLHISLSDYMASERRTLRSQPHLRRFPSHIRKYRKALDLNEASKRPIRSTALSFHELTLPSFANRKFENFAAFPQPDSNFP